MKTYEELYDKYKAKTGQVVNYDSFIEALTEHDREIKGKIGEMIEEVETKISVYSYNDVIYPLLEARRQALTELLNFMELKWKQHYSQFY